MNYWTTCGTVSAFLAVIFGAFAAHGLSDRFEELYHDTPDKIIAGHSVPAAHKYLADFKTGAEYQFWHAFALIIVGLRAGGTRRKLLSAAGWCFLLGTILFSGSLYLLTLLALPKLGMITPIGGLLFLVGWALLTIDFARANSAESIASAN